MRQMQLLGNDNLIRNYTAHDSYTLPNICRINGTLGTIAAPFNCAKKEPNEESLELVVDGLSHVFIRALKDLHTGEEVRFDYKFELKQGEEWPEGHDYYPSS